MAIYHLNAKVISRGKGQSAIAAAAYRSGERLQDEQAGEQKFYPARARRVLFTDILAPKDAPEWAHDRNRLWNEVERAEKRKDAQLAREIEVSLPHELTAEQREWLVKDFAREAFVRRGYTVDIAIHAPDRGDSRNHHAHLMLTMRTHGPDGFASTKDRSLNTDDQLEQWREQWANLANRHLERHGHDARIDHRSLEAQGIDREPTSHAGYAASEMEARGAASDRMDDLKAILERNDIRVDLKALDRELKSLEQEQAAAPVEHRSRDESAIGHGFAEAARETAQESRQEAPFWNKQTPWHAGVDMPRPAPRGGAVEGLKVEDAATGMVTSLADFMLDLFGGLSPAAQERPMDRQPSDDHDARKQAQLARLADIRQAETDRQAVENIRRDMEAGKSLRAEDIRNLAPTHQEQIRLHGDDRVKQMVEDIRRQSEFRGFERERER